MEKGPFPNCSDLIASHCTQNVNFKIRYKNINFLKGFYSVSEPLVFKTEYHLNERKKTVLVGKAYITPPPRQTVK